MATRHVKEYSPFINFWDDLLYPRPIMYPVYRDIYYQLYDAAHYMFYPYPVPSPSFLRNLIAKKKLTGIKNVKGAHLGDWWIPRKEIQRFRKSIKLPNTADEFYRFYKKYNEPVEPPKKKRRTKNFWMWKNSTWEGLTWEDK